MSDTLKINVSLTGEDREAWERAARREGTTTGGALVRRLLAIAGAYAPPATDVPVVIGWSEVRVAIAGAATCLECLQPILTGDAYRAVDFDRPVPTPEFIHDRCLSADESPAGMLGASGR